MKFGIDKERKKKCPPKVNGLVNEVTKDSKFVNYFDYCYQRMHRVSARQNGRKMWHKNIQIIATNREMCITITKKEITPKLLNERTIKLN